MAIKIQKGNEEDIDAMIKFKDKIIAESYEFLTEEEKAQWMNYDITRQLFYNLLTKEDSFAVLCYDDNEIVGMVILKKIQEGASNWTELNNMFTLNQDTAKRAILGASIAIGEGWKMKELRIPVFIQDANAISFFQKWDFFPADHDIHTQLPEKKVLYLRRPLRTKPRKKENVDDLYQ